MTKKKESPKKKALKPLPISFIEKLKKTLKFKPDE